jgi:hypothetical protein
MKNIKEILVCGGEGGSVTLIKENETFFYRTDETTFLELTVEFTRENLINTSTVFSSVEKAIDDLVENYNVFSLFPEKLDPKYKTVLQNAYFKNRTENKKKNNECLSEEWLVKLFQIDSVYKKFVNLNIEQIIKASKNVLENYKEDNYTTSYPYFVGFLENSLLDIEKYVVGTNMVYGWMPTILNLDLSDKRQIERVLEKLNKKEKLSMKDFEILKRSINNSIVGMSKFLHFVDPYTYPILDRKIYKFITGKEYATGIDQSITYVAYLNKMTGIIKDERFNSLYISVNSRLGKKLSPMRSLELILFYNK